MGTEALKRMLTIRTFEQNIAALVNANRVTGVTHEYIGQEAVAVGICAELQQDDVITSTHRGHGHVIAKGGDIVRMFAELMGRATGMNRGRGGSMHIADVSIGVFGANGIVAAGAPIAGGAALAMRLSGTDRVSATFFGDGGSNQGVLFETLNLAALWKLPMLFVCENNGYAATTSIDSVLAVKSISKRAAAFGMPAETVDGMDVRAVRDAAQRAVTLARSGGGPSFIEALTYRFVGHHTAETLMKMEYRSDEELVTWKERDPIELEAARLLAEGVSDAAIDELRSQVAAHVKRAIEMADGAPRPSPESATDFMYASGTRPVGGRQ
ncbi:MAG TPA: thiamine pyrophosphate-dependent dehydrogenase E1 component subunit alpha [Candidatus Saccharimonadales bacterium]|nr:thiamine pyrophosphate-dependent dehydrogenase E1 component subunit alpha [Candidatus Saccharimonadales bacterium]